ncbi:hypothetical protein HpMS107_49640 [Helicobacter pylori]
MATFCTAGQAAGLSDMREEIQIDQVEAHDVVSRIVSDYPPNGPIRSIRATTGGTSAQANAGFNTCKWRDGQGSAKLIVVDEKWRQA